MSSAELPEVMFPVSKGNAKNAKKVFVVHGRNLTARNSMFVFLRAIGLEPIEFSTAISATGSASPYIGQALDAAFDMAQAVVILLTPDDIAYLRPEYASGDDDPERLPTPRPDRTCSSRQEWRWGVTPNEPSSWNSAHCVRSVTSQAGMPCVSTTPRRSATTWRTGSGTQAAT
ncbi:hypothetical protein MOKP20_33200 [Mycobacterium avium subsp. hominissuis]|nr:TIR domain-containing protein [Mycobacterium avium]